jgi:uncharacterized membrane protein YkoI
MTRLRLILAMLAALALQGAAAAEPHGLSRQPGWFDMAQRGDYYPLERILRSIDRQYPGHQLSVSGPSGGGSPVYRIKWLTDAGAVLYIVADAYSGAILSVDGG